MKRKRLLQRDAATDAVLPFNSAVAQLQLLGFLLPYGETFPAAVPMVCAYGHQHYVLTNRGEAYLAGRDSHGQLRKIDLPLSPSHTLLVPVGDSVDGGRMATVTAPTPTIKVGMVAFALSPDRVFFGADWAVRKRLRQELSSGGNGLDAFDRVRISDYLKQDAIETLAVRHWQQGVEAGEHREQLIVSQWPALENERRGKERKKADILEIAAMKAQSSRDALAAYRVTRAWAMLSRGDRLAALRKTAADVSMAGAAHEQREMNASVAVGTVMQQTEETCVARDHQLVALRPRALERTQQVAGASGGGGRQLAHA